MKTLLLLCLFLKVQSFSYNPSYKKISTSKKYLSNIEVAHLERRKCRRILHEIRYTSFHEGDEFEDEKDRIIRISDLLDEQYETI
tara:strand:- start:2972 stop:3226 length:255 start_codon:yes stop_codon:yes gene_type:complete